MSGIHVKYNKEISEMHAKYSSEVNEMHTKLRGILDHFKQIGMPLPNNFGIELSTPPRELIRSSCHSVDPNAPDPLLDLQDPIVPEKTKVHHKHKKVDSKGSTTHTQKHEGQVNGDAELQNLSENCKYLHDVMMLPTKSNITSVVKDSEVFKCNLVEGQPISVSRDDIAEFLRMSCLNIPILQIFMMYIHKLCRESNVDDFGFMCPSALALCPQQRGGTQCGYYVMRYMYDIVSQYCKNGETNWTKGVGRMESYTRQQIDEIRDIWADFFTNEYF
ncbi:hypothetical protein POM88_028479 [Heracleum sosnowskyi]|uniref:Ubiquitin-like protease family profile domain-containing protein n=1 Tax=Heracleum sosnowskyi TaxID=360622 RepID=A0AAD8MGB9_9APIA|nr:hypothetical protein POM88_028479 [Heracleum sosnowskyi]